MESCHSVVQYDGMPVKPLTTPVTTKLLSTCHPPVYRTLGHLITIIEQLRCRNVQLCTGEMDDEGLARNALRILLECENHITDKMAVPGKNGTPNHTITNTVVEDLEMELKKLQQTNETNIQEIADQQKKMKNVEQKLKSYQDKNKKFLEKNVELTMINRNLKDQMTALTDDNKKMKEHCETSKKRVKQLNILLNHEKLERGTAEIKLQELNNLKQQVTELGKSNTALKQAGIEKDRRIELMQHRKKRKRILKSQNVEKGLRVKETFFGYDEDDTSIDDSEASFSSLSHGTMSDDELCDELSREEIQRNYEKLMKEHLQLQKLHSTLQSQANDVQAENKVKHQIESDLFSAQVKIEELQTLLRQHDEEMHECRNEKSKILNNMKMMEQKNEQLSKEKNKLKSELNEAQESMDNMEFRIIELESEQASDRPNDHYYMLETIPEDPQEMSDIREGALAPPPYDRDGAESPEVMGYRLQEKEMHIKGLEQTAKELQKKISSLQQEKARLEDQKDGGLSLEEREAQEVLNLKASLTNSQQGNEDLTQNTTDIGVHGNNKINQSGESVITNGDGSSTLLDENNKTKIEVHDQSIQTDILETKDVASITNGESSESKSVTKSPSLSPLPSPTPSPSPSPSPDQKRKHPSSSQTGEFSELSSCIISLQHDVTKLLEENSLLRSHLQDSSMSLEEELDSHTVEAKMVETLTIYENLQERLFCSERTVQQLKDRMKMMEHTVEELEANESMLRDQLEETVKYRTESRRMSTTAQNKIAELKQLILDKDVIEMNLGEKVQFLEKAEMISSRRITELEGTNQMLQQRLDLKEDLEADVHLVETLQQKVDELQSENDELIIKVTELEESEEILKINWKKVAENDANRIQNLEEKVRVLDTCTKELRTRLREQQDRSPMPETNSGPSLAAELTESEKMDNSDSDQSDNPLQTMQKRYQMLEQELHEMEESKNAKIESLQERIAYLKDNEIKLSETLIEMESEEKDLRSRLSMYERQGAGNTKLLYEDKIKALKSSQGNLLDRLDSMEEHEEDLKTRLSDMEKSYEAKLDQYEREISKYMEQEELTNSKIQELEKHEDELMEKIEELESIKADLEAENETLNNQMDRYFEHEKELIESTDTLQQDKDKLQTEVEAVSEKCLIMEKNLQESEEENYALNVKLEEFATECEQIKSENDDLNERLIELDSSEQELLEKLQKLERNNANIEHLKKKVDVLEEAETRLMDRVLELEEIEVAYSKLKNTEKKDKATDTDEVKGEDTVVNSGKVVSSDFTDQSTDTCDLVDNGQGHKVTGQLFERLQELESENSSLSEKLSMCTATDAHVKQLSEKVRLLEQTEDKLMERVMELEDVEDKMKRDLAKARLSVGSLPEIDGDFEAMQKMDNDIRDKIDQMQIEKEDIQSKLRASQETVSELQQTIDQLEVELKTVREKFQVSEQELSEVKQTVKSLKDGEKKLMKIIEVNKSKCEDLEQELTNTQEKLEEVQTEYELKLSDYETQVLDCETKNVENETKLSEYKTRICDMENLLDQSEESFKSLKGEINSLVKEKQVLLERIDELQQAEKEIQLSSNQNNSVHSPDHFDSVNVVSSSNQNQEILTPANQDCVHSSHVISSTDHTDSAGNYSPSEVMQLNAKCQEMEQKIKQNSEQKEIYLQKIEELENKLKNISLHTPVTKNVDVTDSVPKRTPNSVQSVETETVHKLNDQISAFHKVVKDVVAEIDRDLCSDGSKGRHQAEASLTFLDTANIPSCIEGSVRTSLIDLLQCKACLKQRLSSLQTQKREGQGQRSSESLLSSPTMTGSIEKPEDILRQKIGELERLEKHLKQQVLDLEHDQDELHDIARKDKNTIHDQNVRIRELQLSEKNLKEQVGQYEVSERTLYNKVEELEDQISKLEDRISELRILEMRLKELVRKYKLDEEVWLSKSENLETSMTELSVSEAKLKKTLQSVEKEKEGLAEKSEYLQLRLKELENAEENLLQRVKEYENKEISLNNKLSEIQSVGSAAEMQNSELQAVNIDLTQRLNQAVQENAALSFHTTQLQNQLHAMDQQLITLKDSEIKLKQELGSAQKVENELQKQLKETQLKDVDNQTKVRQVEEGEAVLRDKISMLQRSENRLKYRIQELESCGTQMPLEIPNSQKDKIPRKLEDCQRRIIVLQNQNDKLKERLQDYQNISKSKTAVKLPIAEFQDMQSKVALLEQTELHLDEVEQTNAALLEEISRLRNDPEIKGHEANLENLEKTVEQSNKTVQMLRRLINERQSNGVGTVVNINNALDQPAVSNRMYRETAGHLAERGLKGRGQMTRSVRDGHHVQINDELSDASTVEEDSIGKTVRGNNNTQARRGLATTDNRNQMIDDLVSHLESSEENPLEESHWRTVETLSPRAVPGQVHRNSEKGQVIGRATSLYTNGKKNMSHIVPDEELVLGVTFPSESESQWYSTQNDTDSTMSPLIKRRKFRPTESVDSNTPAPPLPQTMPPNMHNSHAAGNDFFASPGRVKPQNRAHDSSDDIMQEEFHKGVSSALHAPIHRGEPHGRGTKSRSQDFRERIAEVQNVLQRKPKKFMDTTDEDEDIVMTWKRKASDAVRKLENFDKENKFLKDEINKLEKELENRSRYIYMMEKFLDKISEVLESKDERSDKEIVQIIEAELEKLRHEITDSGHRKLELSQDLVALNTELNKRDRELIEKKNEVESLMRELKQWQEECHTIEDMRNSALDSLHCLEVEAREVPGLEKSLKDAKDEHNRLTGQFEEMKSSKDDALVALAPLRSKVNSLSKKCKEKDEFIKRLGGEIRKMKGVGKPSALLEELRHMEDMMAAEEYNNSNLPPGDLERSSSASSLSDSHDPGIFSDSETLRSHQTSTGNRPRSADQWDRRQKPIPSRSPPHVQRKSAAKQGHMPQNTSFIAISDYDPRHFSRSGRPRLELPLSEGDYVKITGPLDQNGYYEAEVRGQVGLVPAEYLQPSQEDLQGIHTSPQDRHQKQLQMTPLHLDCSPEKILQMHSQLQQSHSPRRPGQELSPMPSPRVNGYMGNTLSPRTPRDQRPHVMGQSSPKYSIGVPDAPSNLKVEKVIDHKSALLTWTPPHLNELAQSNNSQVIGYKIYLNGKVHHQVNSPHLTKATVDKLDFSKPLRFGIQTLTTAGPVSVVQEMTYCHTDTDQMEKELENGVEDLSKILNSSEYVSGRKRQFMAVYDYDPVTQSPNEYPSYDLGFHAGDVVTVFGKERPDGYYYGKMNGRRGLVPALFLEEIPLTSSIPTKQTKSSHTIGAQKGHIEVKQTTQR